MSYLAGQRGSRLEIGFIMTNARTITPAQRFSAVSSLRVKGDRYGHAAIAGLAHELAMRLDGDKFPAGAATSVVEGTGYDKGTVSRVGKIVRTNKAARKAALALDVIALDKASTSDATFSQGVAVGELFKRQPASGSTRTPAEVDALAVAYDWATGNDTRIKALADLVTRLQAEAVAVKKAA